MIMSGSNGEGDYCVVCGGISPSKITTKMILIDGKEIGIDGLDRIIDGVRQMGLSDDEAIQDKLLELTKASNYVPTKKAKAYREALLNEYKQRA